MLRSLVGSEMCIRDRFLIALRLDSTYILLHLSAWWFTDPGCAFASNHVILRSRIPTSSHSVHVEFDLLSFSALSCGLLVLLPQLEHVLHGNSILSLQLSLRLLIHSAQHHDVLPPDNEQANTDLPKLWPNVEPLVRMLQHNVGELVIRSEHPNKDPVVAQNHQLLLVDFLHQGRGLGTTRRAIGEESLCLLYTSDAADEEDSVDLGGRRIIKKKKNKKAARTLANKIKNTNEKY
eukprot:TRINITY_DN23219_c0_g1_i3.p1 TRINITY_DN23219_c0_g1~~TRINITY_DN23219_c0_g1_i3.p1  ORF type:complete len:235 (-),score=30.03 TRINITY_DN23219_c0_g1_i3:2-706(-)